MPNASPFHAGEQAVQTRLGVREDIEPWARKVVRPVLPAQHREFYEALPFVVAAARDERGRPWATLLAGEPGFARSPEPGALEIDAVPVAGDALEGSLAVGADLGLLGIELSTRRRNRVNGRVSVRRAGGIALAVDQAFGNCPQYIHERDWRSVPPNPSPTARRHSTLTPELRRWIEGSDTLFIATGHRVEGEDAAFGMDASHRGGDPGFVQVDEAGRLVFPDYAGNNHFNTIGNLLMDPRAGLLFVDFEGGGMLQLTGRIRIDWDSPAVAAHPGARRLVIFELEEAVELDAALPLRWEGAADSVRSLRVVSRIRESEDVTSFVLEARDGGALPDFDPGQHLPIVLDVPGESAPVRRTYSLSNAPGSGRYRISVKREARGVASRHLHDAVEEGAIVDVRRPAGEFVLHAGERPVVLVSAGVGVTPMASMLGAMVEAEDPRPTHFFHVARDGAHHPLADEVRSLAARGRNVQVDVSYTRPRGQDRVGRDFDAEGRLHGDRIAALAPASASDFYLCGPPAFMAEIQDRLEALGVSAERIHSESFGPSA